MRTHLQALRELRRQLFLPVEEFQLSPIAERRAFCCPATPRTSRAAFGSCYDGVLAMMDRIGFWSDRFRLLTMQPK